MNAHSIRGLLQLTFAFAVCTSVAAACGSGSGKKAANGNRFNPNDGGQANAGAAGDPSTGGSSQTAGSSQGGSSTGAQAGSASDGGANDGGRAGSASDGGQAGSASEGGATTGAGGANDGNAGQTGEAGGGSAGEAGTGGAGGFANCAEVETSVGPSLLNGSFELPALGSPRWLVIAAGQEPEGFAWSVLDDVDISYVGWSSGQGVVTGPAKDGLQYLDVVAFGSDGALKQTIDVVPGVSYVLELSYANNPVTDPLLATASATVTARVCDHIIFSETITHSTSIISDFDWTDFSRTFEATDSIVTLEIVETLGGGNGGIFLDAVSLNPAP